MNKSAARTIIQAALKLGAGIDEIDAEVRQLPDLDERKALLISLYKVMTELNSGLIRPIVRQHPDLDPDTYK